MHSKSNEGGDTKGEGIVGLVMVHTSVCFNHSSFLDTCISNLGVGPRTTVIILVSSD